MLKLRCVLLDQDEVRMHNVWSTLWWLWIVGDVARVILYYPKTNISYSSCFGSSAREGTARRCKGHYG